MDHPIIPYTNHTPFQFGNFEIQSTGLIVHGQPDIQEWLSAGNTFRQLETAIQWVLGDWLNYGERRYGERYAQALDGSDYAIHTLQNYAYVAGSVEVSRRREALTFSHHAEVAALPPQEQFEKLDMAEKLGMTVRELRELIRGDERPPRYTYTAQVVIDGSAVMLEILDSDTEALLALRNDRLRITVEVRK